MYRQTEDLKIIGYDPFNISAGGSVTPFMGILSGAHNYSFFINHDTASGDQLTLRVKYNGDVVKEVDISDDYVVVFNITSAELHGFGNYEIELAHSGTNPVSGFYVAFATNLYHKPDTSGTFREITL